MNINTTFKMAPSIMLYSGAFFDFLNPEVSAFTIDDIAHALSHICRFTGHCDKFYSVAQHSVLVSHLVPPELAFEGLMHDAAEAFLGDVSSPLKQMLPDYQAIEKRIEAAVFGRFGLPAKLPPEVKHADMVALVTEKRDLMDDREDWPAYSHIVPNLAKISPWQPGSAKAMFLFRFENIMMDRLNSKIFG